MDWGPGISTLDSDTMQLKLFGNYPDMEKVYKKTSRGGELTLYLGKRDYVDHVENVDIVDGVVKLESTEFGDRKVWVQLLSAFRYGTEDLDVVGLVFKKEIWYHQEQLYPASHKPTLSPMHETLLKKAGANAYPFSFSMPNNLPCSMTLKPATDDKGKPCGVDYMVTTYIATEADDIFSTKFDKKDTARLRIRKIQFAPNHVGPGPKADICRNFMMTDKPIHLEASLDKDLFSHGEAIPIKIKIKNETAKVIKNIKITVDQTTDVVLYSADKYTKCVHSEEFAETIDGGASFDKTLSITPLLSNIKETKGVALDGRMKDEDTNLASTTIIRPGMDNDVLAILVTYKITVHLMVAGGGMLGLTTGDVSAELPLMLMHSKPQEVALE